MIPNERSVELAVPVVLNAADGLINSSPKVDEVGKRIHSWCHIP